MVNLGNSQQEFLMQIKKIITGGCSFSDQYSRQSWIYRLQDKYPKIKFRHTGFCSQGQELIQKKMSLALYEELQTHDPGEILVLPMWSGTERKAFWVDDKEYIKEIITNWPKRGISWGLQFHDLYSKADDKDCQTIESGEFLGNKRTTKYHTKGGWYNCSYLQPDSGLTDEFFKASSTVIGYATTSLENIIFLHNFCKLKGVKIYHSFYRNYVYDDIYQNREHLNLKYLFNQWDRDTIVSTTGIYEYLRPNTETETFNIGDYLFTKRSSNDETKQYFELDDWHPNAKGHSKWTEEVLIPRLKEKGVL